MSTEEFSAMSETVQKLYLEARYEQLSKSKPQLFRFKSARLYVAERLTAAIDHVATALLTAILVFVSISLYRTALSAESPPIWMAGAMTIVFVLTLAVPAFALLPDSDSAPTLIRRLFASVFLRKEIATVQRDFDERSVFAESEYAAELEAHQAEVEQLEVLQAAFLKQVNKGVVRGSVSFEKGKLCYS